MQSASYVWAKDYQAAVLEVDPRTLTAKIAKAETSIQQRKSELLQSPGASDELEAIARASRVLNILREITQKHA